MPLEGMAAVPICTIPHRPGESVPLASKAEAVSMGADRRQALNSDRTRDISTGEIDYASEIK
jgi:hypothetical protein